MEGMKKSVTTKQPDNTNLDINKLHKTGQNHSINW